MRTTYLSDRTLDEIAQAIHDKPGDDALIPGRGLRRTILAPPTWLVEHLGMWRWSYLERQAAKGKKPYGLKELSGKESLDALLEQECTISLLPPHVAETDYAHGAFFKHALGLEAHFVAGNNLTKTDARPWDLKAKAKKFMLNGAFDTYRILRIDRDAVKGRFLKAFTQIHANGGSTIVYPGATRDRANSAYGALGSEVLSVLILAQNKVDAPIYAVPVSATWDHIFRESEKVHQLVKDYKRQDASELGTLVVPLLRDAIQTPLYMHVGEPINVKELIAQEGKGASRALFERYNASLIDGVYLTTHSLVGLAAVDAMGYQGSVQALADRISASIREEGLDPKAASTEDIAFHGRLSMKNSSFVQETTLLSHVGYRLEQAREAGVRQPAILRNATPAEVLDLAVAHGAGSFMQRDDGYYQIDDPLVAAYYASPLRIRLAKDINSGKLASG